MTEVRFSQDLIDDVARRRVAIFAGSGVSASAKTRAGQPLKDWPSFLAHAATKMDSKEGRALAVTTLENRDYLLACEFIKGGLTEAAWADLIYKEFAQIGEPSALHSAIVQLGQRVVVTTNFDKLIETTWAGLAKEDTHFPSIITKLDSNSFRVFRDDMSYLFKIHGTIDDPESMIFAKSDYSRSAFSNWVYTEFFECLSVNFTVLFVGFSMADPAIAMLIEKYAQKYPGLRPHYIFQSGPIPDPVEDVSKRLRKLYILPYDKKDHHAELPVMMSELAKLGRARRKELFAGAQSL